MVDEAGQGECRCMKCAAALPLGAWLTAGNFRYACEICGNKRCPHHTDHELACTNSNEPGQPGSAY